MKSWFCKIFGGNCFLENVCSNRCGVERLVDDWLAKQRERAKPQSRQDMLNSYYAENHKIPWVAYIELSQAVLMLEDFEKIIEYIGLKNVLFARSNDNRKLERLPKLQGISFSRISAKFVVFACGDFYIACLLGSRHILVVDKETYQTSFCEDYYNISKSFYVQRKHAPIGNDFVQNLFHDYFIFKFNYTSMTYEINCDISDEKMHYFLSSQKLNREIFLELAKKNRQMFFCRSNIFELFGEKDFIWSSNQIELGFDNLLTAKVNIPEDMLTC